MNLRTAWGKAWMTFAGRGVLGRKAMWIASWAYPPYYGRVPLAKLRRGRCFIAWRARLAHRDLELNPGVFIDDGVTIYQDTGGGPVELGPGVHLHCDTIVQTGAAGAIRIGDGTHVQPRCILSAYAGPINIGRNVEIAPHCCFYPYNHRVDAGVSMQNAPLESRGGIRIGDGAWLGAGVIVLDGTTIGDGAVIAAGAVVRGEVPPNTIYGGVPAKRLGERPRT